MKPGVSVYSFVHSVMGGMSISELFRLYQAQGIKYIELLDQFIEGKYTPEYIKAQMEQYGLTISSYSISNDFVHCESLESEIDRVKRGIDSALFYGANVVRVFSANPKEGMDFESCFQLIVNAFKQCVPYAEEKQVVLALENHGVMAGKSTQVLRLLESVGSSWLKSTSDTGNFLLVNEAPYEAIKRLLPHIGLVHFKDFMETPSGRYETIDHSKRFDGCELGKGEVPLEKIVRLLKDSGYEGHISIEYEGASENISEVAASFRYLCAQVRSAP